MVDDLGWGDVGYHGGTLHTPALDRLARQGVEMHHFYVYPLCSPTRVAFLTGQMPRRFGIADALGPRQPGMPAGLPTLPRTFQSAGYQTFLVGKWHVGTQSPPRQSGFDHFYGYMGAEVDYFKHTGRSGELDWQRDGQPLTEEGYSTFLLADEAIRSLETRDAKRPFFLEVAFNAPHFPLSAPDEYVAKYKSYPGTRGTYAAVVDALDNAIGRVLTALDKQGLHDNTLVLFLSDNGAEVRLGGSNGAFRDGKGSLYEGGIRTPCLLRWPGHIRAGSVSQQLLAVEDLYPTLVAAAGVPMKEAGELDGVNLWPALRAETVKNRAPIVLATTDFAVIDGDWKLIENSAGRKSLYQTTTDPGESADVCLSHPEVAQRLETELEKVKQHLPAATARPRPGQGNRGGGGGRPGAATRGVTP